MEFRTASPVFAPAYCLDSVVSQEESKHTPANSLDCGVSNWGLGKAEAARLCEQNTEKAQGIYREITWNLWFNTDLRMCGVTLHKA